MQINILRRIVRGARARAFLPRLNIKTSFNWKNTHSYFLSSAARVGRRRGKNERNNLLKGCGWKASYVNQARAK